MKKKKPHITPALIASLLILNISATIAGVSCTQIISENKLPAYYFDVQSPTGESPNTLDIERGSSVTLTITITSNTEVPISIRLTQDTQRMLPDFITFGSRYEYITIQPGENATLNVTFHVSENATPGSYTTGIHGELKEPVENRSLLTQVFNIVVTERKSEGE